MKEVRCAIYTRKSNKDGLEQVVNSLDAQRLACENYINNKPNWVILPKRYDDGGYSGKDLNRPAIQGLFADIKAGRIDCVVVYKLDRLSRETSDCLQTMSLFKKNKVTFLAVTQEFDANTSMGRWILTMMFGHAQFEREMTIDRIIDKIAISKQKGLWVGGCVPIGYEAKDKRLVINEEEAKIVRRIFERFVELKSVSAVAKELNSQGYRIKERKAASYGNNEFKKATVRGIIANPIYIGKVRHKDKCDPGQHEEIIDQELWDKAQATIGTKENSQGKYEEAPLKGIIRCHACNVSMAATYTRKRNKNYRYYVCRNHLRGGNCPSINRTIAGGEVEKYAIEEIRYLLANSEQAVKDVNVAIRLKKLNEIWEDLFPIKQQEIFKSLVKKVWIRDDGIELCIGAQGLQEVSNAYGA